jgi:hypothetical protein
MTAHFNPQEYGAAACKVYHDRCAFGGPVAILKRVRDQTRKRSKPQYDPLGSAV